MSYYLYIMILVFLYEKHILNFLSMCQMLRNKVYTGFIRWSMCSDFVIMMCSDFVIMMYVHNLQYRALTVSNGNMCHI